MAAKTIETSVKAVAVVCWNGVALAAVYTSPRTAASTSTTASAEPARSCTVGMSFDFALILMGAQPHVGGEAATASTPSPRASQASESAASPSSLPLSPPAHHVTTSRCLDVFTQE